jgi:hypothetical protein
VAVAVVIQVGYHGAPTEEQRAVIGGVMVCVPGCRRWSRGAVAGVVASAWQRDASTAETCKGGA